MSYVNPGSDGRAHTTAREKERHAKQIVDFAKALVVDGQPNGVEACNECVGATLILALGELVHGVADGDHSGEQLGMAGRLKDLARLCHTASAMLTGAAVKTAIAA